MEKQEKRIVPKIRENRLELLLFILSIVQGLAFTRLIEVSIEALKSPAGPWGTAVIAVHAVFCFLIILRLFETILLAFLDYDEVVVSFSEVIMIFIIGALEYWVIDSLSEFTPAKFYLRVVILAALSLIGYVATTVKISGRKNRRMIFEDYSSFIREIKLQALNIVVPSAIITFAVLIVSGVITTEAWLVLIALILSALVVINIIVSWVVTVTGPKVTVPWDYDLQTEPSVIEARQESIAGDHSLKQAQISDSLSIAELYVTLFPYVFRDVFETSDRIIVKILTKIVSFNQGKSYFGYRKVSLAVLDDEKRTAAGFITLTVAGAVKAADSLVTGIYSLFYIFYYTGLWGVFRVIRNTFRNRKASPDVREDELYISYIGVLPDYRRQGIAGKLLQHAEQTATSMGKRSLGLDVREDNISAIELFRNMGFKEIARIDDKAFGKPPRIYMSKVLSGSDNQTKEDN
ncbi:MAG: N-acetyltransferase [Bacteroidales bacterium]|nr:N-acetyltransferase [Bacteroidales bacterium]